MKSLLYIFLIFCSFCIAFSLCAQNIGVNTTGAAPAATNMFEVLQPSTTANSVGIYSSHSGAIAGGTGYGFQALKSGASLNNIAAYLNATGATNNYALIVPSGGGLVGIGTITPVTSLDVNGAYSARSSIAAAAAGVVIPNNVSLFRLTATGGVQANALSVATPQAGQFLTIVNLDGDPATFGGATLPATNGMGSFVYEGAAWRVISISTGAAEWALLGNAGTVDATNFIGTTDNIPFNIRVNNEKAGRIDNTLNTAFWGYQSGNVNTGADNTFLGSLAGDVNTSGTANTFLGKDAGGANITTSNNTFLGYQAGLLNTAANNTFVGKSAGDANTSGTLNTFLGIDAGGANTTTSNNTFLGYQAGLLNTAANNTFIGKSAGDANTTGTSNTFIGIDAGGANTTAINNTFIGYQSGLVNTKADNTFIGKSSGQANTLGVSNTFIGSEAGFSNIGSELLGIPNGGDYNTFIGNKAGYSGLGNVGVLNYANVFIGYQSGYTNEGGYNVFIGNSSGYLNSSGGSNVFIGNGSGSDNTTGLANVFVGASAGANNSTGGYNVAVGFEAGRLTTTENYNTMIGNSAGYTNTGTSGTFLGSYAGYANTTGSFNTFLGDSAGRNNTNTSNNTFVGFKAGLANTTGANNTYLGYNAAGSAALTNATAIGYNASVTTSNSLVLGGTGADVVNTGVGLTNPAFPLDVLTSTALRGINVLNSGAAGNSYGIFSSTTGANATNRGIYAECSGGTANNRAVEALAFDAAPMAIRAEISGVTTGESRAVYAVNSTVTSTNWQFGVRSAINGAMTGNSAFGVFGSATSSANNNYGGYFTTAVNPGATLTSGAATANYAGYFNNSSTTGANNYGGYFNVVANTAGSANYAGYFTATGAPTNYGVFVNAGDMVLSYGVVAAGATITIPASTSVIRITDDAAAAANAVTMPAGVDGKVLHIYNNDAQATTGTVIPASTMYKYVYINAAWVREQ